MPAKVPSDPHPELLRGEGNFLVMGFWGCATGRMGRTFMTGLTIMGKLFLALSIDLPEIMRVANGFLCDT